MRMQLEHGEEPRREPRGTRTPQNPHLTPKLGPGKLHRHPRLPGKGGGEPKEEQRPHPIPPWAASSFHPMEDKACGPSLACGKLQARGRILPGERGL